MTKIIPIFMMLAMHPQINGCSASIFTKAQHASFGTSRWAIRRITDNINHDADTSSSLFDTSYKYNLRKIVCMRGGGNNENMEISNDNHHLIGIIDIRSKADTDCILRVQLENEGDDNDNNYCIAKFIDITSFSMDVNNPKFEGMGEDDASREEIRQTQAAAASLTIGSSCHTVYLLLTYDFKDGKTVLHRTLGGVKLMNLVDGIRNRWSEDAERTKLVLLLVPSNDGEVDDGSIAEGCTDKELHVLSHDSKWKKEGIAYLVDRLKQYFELGGDEFQGVDPFGEIKMAIVKLPGQILDNDESKQSASHHMLGIVKDHIQHHLNGAVTTKLSLDDFKETIKKRFESFGGLGALAFQTQQ